MTPEEQKVHDSAIAFAKENKKSIAERLTDKETFPPDANPVSIFMAGSPGAGKTEASKALIEEIGGDPIIRIDPDELRELFPGYTGQNSWLFQAGTSILVDRIHDLVLKKRQSFLLDGTLTSEEVARTNVARSLKKGRFVQILYVYQEPALAWQFVCARERLEGRNIRPETFIRQYFAARKVVNNLKAEFGKDLHVDLILKDRDNSNRVYADNIDRIENFVPEKYSEQDLVKIVSDSDAAQEN